METYNLHDDIIFCPYNASHRIVKSRIQKHLVKCEKNYPENYKVICPYNATHRLFKSEIAEHIIICPSRRLIYPPHCAGTQQDFTRFTCKNDITSTIDCDKNWDNENDDNDWQPSLDETLKTNIKDSEDPFMHNNLTIQRCDFDTQELRPPKGYAEAMFIEQSEGKNKEYCESVHSSMGMGRGRATANLTEHLCIGLGRGKHI